MSFTVIIPARIASTRLPGKPLADLGGKPMVVRVAERAKLSSATDVIVAADHQDIIDACKQFGIKAQFTFADHPSGTDRIAEVAATLGLADSDVIVNVQGDEPLIDPALIDATAALVGPNSPIATAAHPIESAADMFNPHVVKVVLDKNGCALYFSRAAIPWHRDGFAQSKDALPENDYAPLRHIGLYAYSNVFLQTFPGLEPSPLELNESLEQLRALWHGFPIAVHVTRNAPISGVDTPHDLARVQQHFKSAPEIK